jgi:hypothetical protein
MTRCLVAVLLLGISACVNPHYGRFDESGQYAYRGGYEETELSPRIYSIHYQTGEFFYRPVPGADLALYRAAELTLQRGHRYFVVDQTVIEPSTVIIKLLTEHPSIEGVPAYEATEVQREMRKRHMFLPRP